MLRSMYTIHIIKAPIKAYCHFKKHNTILDVTNQSFKYLGTYSNSEKAKS